ncbi:Protein translocase membrane subunit SecG [hydrothermal vent metagenome]|uniref:Protein translocase membrane subunit SecG n=1 Tax=hydrothermal vent metagenome TaxID=652676 RepID=A0A3B1AQL4_9ZZZZ
MLHNVILIIHVLLSISLVGLVLIQQGKGADMGAAFGSGASNTVFGSQGSASFISRATGVIAALFFATSLTLAFLVTSNSTGPVSATDSLSDEQPKIEIPSVPKSDTVIPGSNIPSSDTKTTESTEPSSATKATETPITSTPSSSVIPTEKTEK